MGPVLGERPLLARLRRRVAGESARWWSAALALFRGRHFGEDRSGKRVGRLRTADCGPPLVLT